MLTCFYFYYALMFIKQEICQKWSSCLPELGEYNQNRFCLPSLVGSSILWLEREYHPYQVETNSFMWTLDNWLWLLNWLAEILVTNVVETMKWSKSKFCTLYCTDGYLAFICWLCRTEPISSVAILVSKDGRERYLVIELCFEPP